MNNLKTTLAVILAMAIGVGLQAQETRGYSCSGFGLNGGSLYSFDINDGTPTELAPVCGGTVPSLLTGEYINGTYYAVNNSGPELITVADDGTCTSIGTISGTTGTVTGLSQDLSTPAGTTYLMTTTVGSTTLYTIDVSNGALTTIGNIAGIAGGISLAIDHEGNAYVVDIISDDIFTIDLQTATVIGAGVPITQGGSAINLNFAQDIDADCDATGALVGVLYQGGGDGRYGRLDPTTGEFTFIAQLNSEICGFSVDCGSAIPTMGQWSLFILGLVMTSIGLVFIRRKKVFFS